MTFGDFCTICVTCGAQYPNENEPPTRCIICDEERQYVPPVGQKWTTGAKLEEEGYKTTIKEIGPNLWGFSTEPKVGIGQRSVLIITPDGNILWDCNCYFDKTAIAKIRELGGVKVVTNSHPHFFTRMVDWALEFNAELYVHEADAEWVTRPHEKIQYWKGDSLKLPGQSTVLRLGGHFPGSAVLHWPEGAEGRGALFTGDTIFPVPSEGWVTFMYSYPNLIPLPAEVVQRMKRRLLESGLKFDQLYGPFWHSVVEKDALGAVMRSAERYIGILDGSLQRPGFA